MSAEDFLKTQKVGFVGCGNLGQALLRGFLDSKLVRPENVLISGRLEKKLQKIASDFGVKIASSNEYLVENSDIVILGVKPQDFYLAIEPLARTFHQDHVVISLAAGISLSSIQKIIPNTTNIVRLMPNTAAKVGQSVVAYSATSAARAHLRWLESLFATVGVVVPVEEGEMMEALTIAASAGIGFVFEIMIYWQEWLEERGINPDTARKITLQTFKGATSVAEFSGQTSFVELQRKVTSTKGVTAAGLDSMRELELERALRISFEKAAMRDKELGDSWRPNRSN